MRTRVRNSICALGIALVLIAGVLSVPQDVRPPAVGQAYISDVALAASSFSETANDAAASELPTPPLQPRQWLGSVLILGVWVISVPVLTPILETVESLTAGILPGYFDSARGLLEEAIRGPFNAPTGAAVKSADSRSSSMTASTSSAHDFEVVRDRIDRAIRTGLFIVASPVAAPIMILGLLQAITCAVCSDEPDSLFNFSRRVTDFFFPPLPATTASSAVDNPAPGSAASAPSEPAASTALGAAPRRAQSAAERPATKRPAKAAGRANANKSGKSPTTERQSGRAHPARSAPKASLSR